MLNSNFLHVFMKYLDRSSNRRIVWGSDSDSDYNPGPSITSNSKQTHSTTTSNSSFQKDKHKNTRKNNEIPSVIDQFPIISRKNPYPTGERERVSRRSRNSRNNPSHAADKTIYFESLLSNDEEEPSPESELEGGHEKAQGQISNLERSSTINEMQEGEESRSVSSSSSNRGNNDINENEYYNEGDDFEVVGQYDHPQNVLERFKNGRFKPAKPSSKKSSKSLNNSSVPVKQGSSKRKRDEDRPYHPKNNSKKHKLNVPSASNNDQQGEQVMHTRETRSSSRVPSPAVESRALGHRNDRERPTGPAISLRTRNNTGSILTQNGKPIPIFIQFKIKNRIKLAEEIKSMTGQDLLLTPNEESLNLTEPDLVEELRITPRLNEHKFYNVRLIDDSRQYGYLQDLDGYLLYDPEKQRIYPKAKNILREEILDAASTGGNKQSISKKTAKPSPKIPGDSRSVNKSKGDVKSNKHIEQQYPRPESKINRPGSHTKEEIQSTNKLKPSNIQPKISHHSDSSKHSSDILKPENHGISGIQTQGKKIQKFFVSRNIDRPSQKQAADKLSTSENKTTELENQKINENHRTEPEIAKTPNKENKRPNKQEDLDDSSDELKIPVVPIPSFQMKSLPLQEVPVKVIVRYNERFSLTEDITIIKALTNFSSTEKAKVRVCCRALADSIFKDKRTFESILSRWKKILSRSIEKYVLLSQHRNIAPMDLEPYFEEMRRVQNVNSNKSMKNATKSSDKKGHSRNFSIDEDLVLLKFIFHNVSTAGGYSIGGRDLYRAFARDHPWRPFESWRSRYVKYLRTIIATYKENREDPIAQPYKSFFERHTLEVTMINADKGCYSHGPRRPSKHSNNNIRSNDGSRIPRIMAAATPIRQEEPESDYENYSNNEEREDEEDEDEVDSMFRDENPLPAAQSEEEERSELSSEDDDNVGSFNLSDSEEEDEMVAHSEDPDNESDVDSETEKIKRSSGHNGTNREQNAHGRIPQSESPFEKEVEKSEREVDDDTPARDASAELGFENDFTLKTRDTNINNNNNNTKPNNENGDDGDNNINKDARSELEVVSKDLNNTTKTDSFMKNYQETCYDRDLVTYPESQEVNGDDDDNDKKDENQDTTEPPLLQPSPPPQQQQEEQEEQEPPTQLSSPSSEPQKATPEIVADS